MYAMPQPTTIPTVWAASRTSTPAYQSHVRAPMALAVRQMVPTPGIRAIWMFGNRLDAHIMAKEGKWHRKQHANEIVGERIMLIFSLQNAPEKVAPVNETEHD